MKQSQALLRLLQAHLGAERLHDSFHRVAVGGITNGRDTFGEVMEAFQHGGVGAEILPPMDGVRVPRARATTCMCGLLVCAASRSRVCGCAMAARAVPHSQETNFNTNQARTDRNHAVLGNQALDDVETAVMTVGDARLYPYGLVLDVRTHTPLPPGARVEDGELLVAMPVMRSFELSLKRTKPRPALGYGGDAEARVEPGRLLDAETRTEL